MWIKSSFLIIFAMSALQVDGNLCPNMAWCVGVCRIDLGNYEECVTLCKGGERSDCWYSANETDCWYKCPYIEENVIDAQVCVACNDMCEEHLYSYVRENFICVNAKIEDLCANVGGCLYSCRRNINNLEECKTRCLASGCGPENDFEQMFRCTNTPDKCISANKDRSLLKVCSPKLKE